MGIVSKSIRSVNVDTRVLSGTQAEIDVKYEKPSGGIPKTDLSSAVQSSLGKADTALQSFTETDPTVPGWAKAVTKPSYAWNEIADKPAIPTYDDLAARIPYTLDENNAKTAITIGDRLSTATAFSENSQYTLGDVVTYGNKLFVCIASPGMTIGPSSWASQASYWKQTRLGQNSFCQGHKNTSGHYAFANGYKVHADNNYTHAEGGFTVASGHYTHAEGRHTLATLNSSHSEGLFTEARAAASHASGVKASAVARTSFVWQGTDLGDASIQDVSDVVAADIPMYYDHDPGTFNINPVGGVDGFWIGEHRLSYYLGSGVKNKRSTITSRSFSMSKEETIYVCSFTSAVGTLSITPPQLTSSEVFDFELWITLGASGSVTIPSTWVCVGTALDVAAGHTAYLACRVDNTGKVMYNQYYKA